jgi:hypothetical protein
LQDESVVNKTKPILVVAFFVWAACGALCQSQALSADLRHGDNSPEVRGPEMRKSLPDAPLLDGPCSPITLDTVGQAAVTPGPQPGLAAPNAADAPTNSSTFFDKYLYPSLLQRNLRYRPSSGGSFMGRATDAASRLFVTRDDSGRERLNDSYFVGVLTSVVIQTAHSPYWTRSPSATFNNFGSTVGSDAGLNVLHEFEPGLWQLVNRHTPKFVSRIERHMLQDRNPKQLFSAPAR